MPLKLQQTFYVNNIPYGEIMYTQNFRDYLSRSQNYSHKGFSRKVCLKPY